MKRIGLFILSILLVCSSWAQMVDPVKSDVAFEKTGEKTARLVCKMQIDKGWHVYGTEKKDFGPTPASITFETLEGVRPVGSLKAEGKSQRKYDQMFEMEVEFFENALTLVQSLQITGTEYKITGYFEYGACDDMRCLPPTKIDFEENGALPAVESAEQTKTDYKSDTGDQAAIAEKDQSLLSDSLHVDSIVAEAEVQTDTSTIGVEENSYLSTEAESKGSLWKLFFWGLLAGLIALTTPCVWPIIPMTVSFFIKRKGGLRDALTYGLSIIIIYVGLGLVVTGLFGANALNSLATNAVFNVVFFILLLAFGLSMVGLYDLHLPASWTTSVDSKAEKTTGFFGIFLMAFTLALVSFSCTGPIIGLLLVELATDGGSLFAPAIGMFGFALGLALPFSLFAMFPSWMKQMPKSGSWMETVKVVLGVIEIAFSLKFLSVADLAYGWGLLSRNLFFVLWIGLFASLGIYLLVAMIREKNKKPAFYILHILVATASLWLAGYMVTGLLGAPCTLVSAFAPPMEKTGEEKSKTFDDLDSAMQFARQTGRPVMIDFSGYGCVNCRKMEAAVLSDPEVSSIIYDRFIFVQLFVDDRTPLDSVEVVEINGKNKKLRTNGDKWSHIQAIRYGANSQPYYVLTDANGRMIAQPRAYDEDKEKFLKWLNEALNRFRL